MSRRTKDAAVRISNPCDTCVVRRVKCGVERPCHECRKRGLECTSLRMRKKRGPKGPRQSTTDRARLYQESIAVSPAQRQSSLPATSSDGEDEMNQDSGYHQSPNPSTCSSFRSLLPPNRCDACNSPRHNRRLPLSAYYRFIGIYHTRLYPVWPVVSPDRLMANMAFNEDDNETFGLAAALCAATISQLRLQEHTDSKNLASSLMFSLEAERFRSAYDYRENCGLPSLLTAFFLHMYYSNANKLRTAALLLREAITCCHTLELHRSDKLTVLGSIEQSLRLRVYWLLFISELTFSAQNGLPTVMQPIDAIPDDQGDQRGADVQAFINLTRLFSFLRAPTKAVVGGSKESDGTELATVQAKLSSDGDDAALNETQRVDLCVTRQWIRILTWEYMARHFAMSCHSHDPAFSLLLPVQVGREMLSFFATVDSSFVLAHGYGMVSIYQWAYQHQRRERLIARQELKVFRMADAILDIIMCAPGSISLDGMVLGAGDVLTSLQEVIVMVGGQQSEFFGKLQRRLGTFNMSSLATYRVPPLNENPKVETDKKCAGCELISGSSQDSGVQNDSTGWVLSTCQIHPSYTVYGGKADV